MKFAAVIAAAGKGLRMGGETRKQYLFLKGKPVLARSLQLFSNHESLEEIVIVVPADDLDSAAELLVPYIPSGIKIKYVRGGESRQESIENGLSELSAASGLICIHDAARPLASRQLLDSLLAAALVHGAAVPVVALNDTVKVVDEKCFITSTPPRERLRLVQTPQVFKRELIYEAYNNAKKIGLVGTDDASLVEHLQKPVATVAGELSNIKITSALDLALSSFWLERKKEGL